MAKNKFAFTLAEVLITLGIIGIVAVLTLPSLIQNKKEKEIVTKLKNFQTVMSQAFLSSVNDNESPENWGLDADFHIQDPVLSDKFIPYLKITKDCGLKGKCFYNKDIYFLNKQKWANLYNPTGWGQMTFELADGSLVAMNVLSSDCSSVRGTSKSLQNVCAFLYVDVNGGIQPNVFGKDFFSFYMTKYGIIPTGMPEEFDTNHSFAKNCVGENANGMGCTAWVIYNENLDYLHCKDLAWDGKHSCK